MPQLRAATLQALLALCYAAHSLGQHIIAAQPGPALLNSTVLVLGSTLAGAPPPSPFLQH